MVEQELAKTPCLKCGDTDAEHTTMWSSTPEIIFFQFTRQDEKKRKLNYQVDHQPVFHLSDNQSYVLTSKIHHNGQKVTKGHFTAQIFDSQHNTLVIDDDSVCDSHDTVNSTVYTLSYSKLPFPAPAPVAPEHKDMREYVETEERLSCNSGIRQRHLSGGGKKSTPMDIAGELPSNISFSADNQRPQQFYNPGTNCFANSILSCLLSSPQFCDTLMNPQHYNQFQEHSSFVEEFRNVAFWMLGHKTDDPTGQLPTASYIRAKLPMFADINRQEDACHFLEEFLSKLKEEQEPSSDIMYRLCDSTFYRKYICYDSNCTVTQQHEDPTDSQPIINLAVPANTTSTSLSNMLDAFLRTQVDRECPCGAPSCLQVLSWKHLPEVIPIQVSRFTREGTKSVKSDANVDMPLLWSPDSSTQYRLAADLQHIGTIDSGHYVSYTHSLVTENLTIMCNDEEMQNIHENARTGNINREKSSMFFYTKVPQGQPPENAPTVPDQRSDCIIEQPSERHPASSRDESSSAENLNETEQTRATIIKGLHELNIQPNHHQSTSKLQEQLKHAQSRKTASEFQELLVKVNPKQIAELLRIFNIPPTESLEHKERQFEEVSRVFLEQSLSEQQKIIKKLDKTVKFEKLIDQLTQKQLDAVLKNLEIPTSGSLTHLDRQRPALSASFIAQGPQRQESILQMIGETLEFSSIVAELTDKQVHQLLKKFNLNIAHKNRRRLALEQHYQDSFTSDSLLHEARQLLQSTMVNPKRKASTSLASASKQPRLDEENQLSPLEVDISRRDQQHSTAAHSRTVEVSEVPSQPDTDEISSSLSNTCIDDLIPEHSYKPSYSESLTPPPCTPSQSSSSSPDAPSSQELVMSGNSRLIECEGLIETLESETSSNSQGLQSEMINDVMGKITQIIQDIISYTRMEEDPEYIDLLGRFLNRVLGLYIQLDKTVQKKMLTVEGLKVPTVQGLKKEIISVATTLSKKLPTFDASILEQLKSDQPVEFPSTQQARQQGRGQAKQACQSRGQGTRAKQPNRARGRGRGSGVRGRGRGRGGRGRGVPTGSPTVYQYDFDPTPEQLIKIRQAITDRKMIHNQKFERLVNNNFDLTDLPVQPSIGVGGRKMHEELNALEWDYCSHCHTRWLGRNISRNLKACDSCISRRNNSRKQSIQMFSAENDMHPTDAPECLTSLDPIEKAAVSRALPQMKVYRVQKGAETLKGHCITFHQNLTEFAHRLPPRPADLPMIFLTSPGQAVEVKANSNKILTALKYLVERNPYYADVEIDREALDAYPSNSTDNVQGLNIIEDPTLDVNEGNQATVYTENEHAPTLNETAMSTDCNRDTMEEMIRRQILGTAVEPTTSPSSVHDNSVGDTASRQATIDGTAPTGENVENQDRPTQTAQPDDQIPRVNMPERSTVPVPESIPGFFSMAFPWLPGFCHGNCDITVTGRPAGEPSFMQWVRHLMKHPSRAFSQDSRWLLYVANRYQRSKALATGNVYAQRVGDMTMAELKDAVLKKNNPEIFRKLLYFSRSIPGTRQFFKYESNRARAYVDFVHIMSNNEATFNLFLTLSFADLHDPSLHKLLPGSQAYLGKTVVKRIQDIPPGADVNDYITKTDDFKLRTDAVARNTDVVSWYLNQKLEKFRQYVLEEHLGVCDYIIRVEFQHRSAEHFHMVLRLVDGVSMNAIEAALQETKFEIIERRYVSDEERAAQLAEMTADDRTEADRQQEYANNSRHQVIDFTTSQCGLTAVHQQPDPNLWPGPVGWDVQAPPTNCLRAAFEDVIETGNTLQSDLIQLLNRVQCHKCNKNYCVKNMQLEGGLIQKYCKLHYPFPLIKFEADLAEDDSGRYVNVRNLMEDGDRTAEIMGNNVVYVRNHPWLVAVMHDFLTVWRSNIDCQVIRSLNQLLDYVLKYMLKAEKGSTAFNNVVKVLTAEMSDEDPVRRVFQKVLMKTLGEHDMSKTEAVRIMTGMPFVFYGRKFTTVTLLDSRSVNVNDNDEADESEDNRPATKQNLADRYWKRETDQNFLEFVRKFEANEIQYDLHPKDVSLYTFAAAFDLNWNFTHQLHIPFMIPNYR